MNNENFNYIMNAIESLYKMKSANDKKIVIFGLGQRGIILNKKLSELGIKVNFFCDNDNKKHLCFPDFKLNNVLIEIKGEHFLKDGKWINPYSKIQDGILELKRQCLLQNNVKILYYNDIKDCIDYVINKYGKNFKKIFRRK